MPPRDRQPQDYEEPCEDCGRQVAISGKDSGKGGGMVNYVLQGLILAGITGLVVVTLNLRDNMTRVTTYVTEREKQNDREFARIDKTLDRHHERLNRLEQQRWDVERHPER